MKSLSVLILSVWTMVAPMSAGATMVRFSDLVVGTLSPGGQLIHRFTYEFAGFELEAFQDIEISFSHLQFVSIFNPTGGGGDISVAINQVNRPPGAAGTFSIVAMTDGPSLSRSFTVDAIVSGAMPNTLPFSVNQLQPGTFAFQEQLSTGSAHHMPEPATFGYVALAIATVCIRLFRK